MYQLNKKKLKSISESLSLINVNALLISFPRSGNHLVRMIIEYSSLLPTQGCFNNPNDIYICKNVFPEIPNILKHVNTEKKPILRKSHNVPRFSRFLVRKRVFIFRDWKECITSHISKVKNCDDKGIENTCKLYISLVTAVKSSDLIISYNKILNKDESEIVKLLNYLKIKKNPYRKKLFDNLDQIYRCSSSGKNRDWGGVSSLRHENYYQKNYSELQSRISRIMSDVVKNSSNHKLPALILPYCYSRIVEYSKSK